MKPLAVNDPAAEALFWAVAGAWLLGEAAFAARTTLTSEGRHDPSFIVLSVVFVASFWGAVDVARRSEQLTFPGPGWWPLAAGLALVVAGVTLRVRAIRELGALFTYAVLVHERQRVVDTGPYRRIRHPSYTGLLLATLGVGVALGTWPATAVCFLPPFAAFTWRLLGEERVLARELGEPYREYMRRTWRLVPRVW